MKALANQFDDSRLTNAVATPTCSSCCCCCCCLATMVTSSALLSIRVDKEAKLKSVPNRMVYVIIAALFIPISGIITYLGFWTISTLLKSCTTETYGIANYSTKVCSNPGGGVIAPLMIIVTLLILTFLYKEVRMKKPFIRSVIVMTLISIAFGIEFILGAISVLSFFPAYIGVAILISLSIIAFYRKNLINKA